MHTQYQVNSITWMVDTIVGRFEQNCAVDDHLVDRLFTVYIAHYTLDGERRVRAPIGGRLDADWSQAKKVHDAFVRMSETSARKVARLFKHRDELCAALRRILKSVVRTLQLHRRPHITATRSFAERFVSISRRSRRTKTTPTDFSLRNAPKIP